MEESEKLEFTKMMIGLGEVYQNKEFSDAMILIYWGALEDVPFEAIVEAMKKHVRTSKWFPSPAELRPEAKSGRAYELAWHAKRQANEELRLTGRKRKEITFSEHKGPKHLGDIISVRGQQRGTTGSSD